MSDGCTTLVGMADMDPLTRRRPGAEPRTELLQVRLTKAAMAEIDRRAEKRNLNRSDEARSLIMLGMQHES